MKKNTKFLLITILFILIICPLILEMGVRVLKLSPNLDTQYAAYVADDKIGYRHKPNSHVQGMSANNEFEFDYQHNSIGFRDIERTFEKPAGTFRILALGDSFTYGAGVKIDETYPSVLEKRLQSRTGSHPKKIEIIRAGISRAFPEVERKVLQTYGMKYHPDLIMVGFLPNDIVDTLMAEEAVHVTPSGYLMSGTTQMSAFKEWFYLHSHLWRLLRYKLYDLKSKIAWKQKYSDSAFTQKAWNKIKEEYVLINEIAKENKMPFLLVYIPQKDSFAKSESVPEQILSNLANENKFYFHSTTQALKERFDRNEKLYYPIDGHCTSLGYQTIAQSIFEFLEKNRIVP